MFAAGRIVFAIAVTGFGAVSVIFGDFIHNLQPVEVFVATSTPGYGAAAVLLGGFMVVSGLAILAEYRAGAAAVGVMVMFVAGIALLQVPNAFLEPDLLRSPWWIRTFECLALAGAALVVAGLEGRVPERFVRIGRWMFGGSLPVFGVLHLVYPESVAALVPAMFPAPMFFAYLTAFGNLAAGAAIVTGVRARLAATLTALMYGTYAVTLHIPMQFTDPAVGYRPSLTSMLVAIGFTGAGLIVAGSLNRGRRDEGLTAPRSRIEAVHT